MDAMDKLAIEKAQQPEGWRPYMYESIANGILVTGCMTRIVTRGNTKGQIRYLTGENKERVAVTRAEVDAEIQRMESEARQEEP